MSAKEFLSIKWEQDIESKGYAFPSKSRIEKWMIEFAEMQLEHLLQSKKDQE